MCAACGVPTHVAVVEPDPAGELSCPGERAGQPAKFAALRNPSCRIYLGGAVLAMMAVSLTWGSCSPRAG
jgi:hypothetical protein